MAKKSKSLDVSDGSMDMTSMIDCVFLLIIFFMLVADLKKNDIVRLTLPDADSAITEKEAKLVINIESKGDITVSGAKRSVDDLKVFLNAKYARLEANEKEPADSNGRAWATTAVKIRADENTEFRYVQQVLEACVEANFYKTSFGALGPGDRE